MIDRAALETLAKKHIGSVGSANGASLLLHLANGESFAVSSFVEFLEPYCVVAVYPTQALGPEDLGKLIPKDTKGQLIFDRLILPYHFVTHVTITAREPEKRSKVGFSAL